MRVYQTFDKKNHEGKYYKEWDLPDGFPIPQGYVFVPPTEGLRNPKFDLSKQVWVESEEDLVRELIEGNQVLSQKINSLEDVILELVIMNVMKGGDI